MKYVFVWNGEALTYSYGTFKCYSCSIQPKEEDKTKHGISLNKHDLGVYFVE